MRRYRLSVQLAGIAALLFGYLTLSAYTRASQQQQPEEQLSLTFASRFFLIPVAIGGNVTIPLDHGRTIQRPAPPCELPTKSFLWFKWVDKSKSCLDIWPVDAATNVDILTGGSIILNGVPIERATGQPYFHTMVDNGQPMIITFEAPSGYLKGVRGLYRPAEGNTSWLGIWELTKGGGQ